MTASQRSHTLSPQLLTCALMVLTIASAPSVFAQADGYTGHLFGVTGGEGGATFIMTSASAFISAVGQSSARLVMFSNVFDLGSANVAVRNNKTILGLDADATLIGNLLLDSATTCDHAQHLYHQPEHDEWRQRHDQCAVALLSHPTRDIGVRTGETY